MEKPDSLETSKRIERVLFDFEAEVFVLALSSSSSSSELHTGGCGLLTSGCEVNFSIV